MFCLKRFRPASAKRSDASVGHRLHYKGLPGTCPLVSCKISYFHAIAEPSIDTSQYYLKCFFTNPGVPGVSSTHKGLDVFN